MIRRIIFVTIMVVALGFSLTPSAIAWEEYWGNLTTITQDEDSFWNYDFIDSVK